VTEWKKLGRSGSRWESIKIKLIEIGWMCLDWIRMALQKFEQAVASCKHAGKTSKHGKELTGSVNCR
jgi:hypothetical protein